MFHVMPNPSKDQVFSLIKSLSKSEKRNFKLYTSRIQLDTETKFVRLFELMDKMNPYDERLILQKFPNITKAQLPNLKRHLYGQILTSLRLIYIDKNIDIQIREQLDFARILYGKGLYMQSLKMLDRIKKIAEEHHQDILHLEILEFEKMIEARHITRSRLIVNKMESLLEASARRSLVTYQNNKLSNLNIQTQGWYIQHGHAVTIHSRIAFLDFFAQMIPEIPAENKLTFFEKVNFYQSMVWYHYILLDFELALEFAKRWVQLFSINPQMKSKDPMLFMRGLYYLLTFYYLTGNAADFHVYLKKLERFVEKEYSEWNSNTEITGFLYLTLSQLNASFLTGKFSEGIAKGSHIMTKLNAYETLIDPHKIRLISYKIGCLYFQTGDYSKALEYLNHVVVVQIDHLRSDLEINSRILHMICHYELKNVALIKDYLLPNTLKAIEKAKEQSKIQLSAIELLKALTKGQDPEVKKSISDFKLMLSNLDNQSQSKKDLAYLDLRLWIMKK
jgi:tetratricopeptide (TPR) repeat protein